jgi:paraquat-inducible protein B
MNHPDAAEPADAALRVPLADPDRAAVSPNSPVCNVFRRSMLGGVESVRLDTGPPDTAPPYETQTWRPGLV